MIAENYIIQALENSPDIVSAFGDKIFNGFVPIDTTSPCMRFFQISSDPMENTSGGTFEKIVRFQFDSYSVSAQIAKENQKKIFDSLLSNGNINNYQVTMINSFVLKSETNNDFIVSGDYQLVFTEL